jgi:hypothetical protein
MERAVKRGWPRGYPSNGAFLDYQLRAVRPLDGRAYSGKLWVVVARVRLGVNEGLTWSTTVVVKVNLAGFKRRVPAMRVNEFLRLSGRGSVCGDHGVGGLALGRAPLTPHTVFLRMTLGHRDLSSATQVGFVNNLNDGMVWGLFPVLVAGLDSGWERAAHCGRCVPRCGASSRSSLLRSLGYAAGVVLAGVVADSLRVTAALEPPLA